MLTRTFPIVKRKDEARTAEKNAASILMPISSRRQLNDLPDDLAAKITIHYYLDARDALLKALSV